MTTTKRQKFNKQQLKTVCSKNSKYAKRTTIKRSNFLDLFKKEDTLHTAATYLYSEFSSKLQAFPDYMPKRQSGISSEALEQQHNDIETITLCLKTGRWFLSIDEYKTILINWLKDLKAQKMYLNEWSKNVRTALSNTTDVMQHWHVDRALDNFKDNLDYDETKRYLK